MYYDNHAIQFLSSCTRFQWHSFIAKYFAYIHENIPSGEREIVILKDRRTSMKAHFDCHSMAKPSNYFAVFFMNFMRSPIIMVTFVLHCKIYYAKNEANHKVNRKFFSESKLQFGSSFVSKCIAFSCLLLLLPWMPLNWTNAKIFSPNCSFGLLIPFHSSFIEIFILMLWIVYCANAQMCISNSFVAFYSACESAKVCAQLACISQCFPRRFKQKTLKP